MVAPSTGRSRIAAGSVALLAAALAGCTGADPTAAAATSPAPARPAAPTRPAAPARPAARATGPSATGASAGGIHPSGASGAGAAADAPVIRPPAVGSVVAGCRLLVGSRAAGLLGTRVSSAVADGRADPAGQVQVDGCVYSGSAGVRLSYLVWTIEVAPTRMVVSSGLAPSTPGVTRFVPGLGSVSAGAAVAVGPTAVVQVNAARVHRLVQVTVSGTGVVAARAAAVRAAAELLTAR